MNQTEIASRIENIWLNKQEIFTNPNERLEALKFLNFIIDLLNSGKQRACHKQDGTWHVNEHIKKAILLLFSFSENKIFNSSVTRSYDKVSLKFGPDFNAEDFAKLGVRIVPGSFIRSGTFIGSNVVIMPSFINIGAYIDDNSMIDSMTTIGSCAQIGKSCHISSGVTIAGVLEPLNQNPVIIEDECFIGSGAQISEGIIIGKGSVIGAGVVLTGSTKIYDKDTNKITYGYIPPYSVVVPGIIPYTENYKVSFICAVIAKSVDKQTRAKTSINQILRLQ